MIIKYISEAMLKLIAQAGNHPLSPAAQVAAGVPITSERNKRRLANKPRR